MFNGEIGKLSEITVICDSGLPSRTMIVSADIFDQVKKSFPKDGTEPQGKKDTQNSQQHSNS